MKHSHYKKSVGHLQFIDVYRVCQLFDVADPAIQHAVKKLLCAGQRGAKNNEQDYREAIDSINRALQMIAEDCNAVGPAEAARAEELQADDICRIFRIPRELMDGTGGWIEWGGGSCPVDPAVKVDVKTFERNIYEGTSAGLHFWGWDGAAGRIIAYRIAKDQS